MDKDEFVKLMLEQNQFSMSRMDLKQAFHIFDRDHRGFFMSSELRDVFRRLEENISDHEINEILQDEWDGYDRKIVLKGEQSASTIAKTSLNHWQKMV